MVDGSSRSIKHVDDHIDNISKHTAKDATVMLQETPDWNKLDQQKFNQHTLFAHPKSECSILLPISLATRIYRSKKGPGRDWLAI